MNPWVVLNLEFELMSVAALRDEEYVQQAVHRYSDIQHCWTAGYPDSGPLAELPSAITPLDILPLSTTLNG